MLFATPAARIDGLAAGVVLPHPRSMSPRLVFFALILLLAAPGARAAGIVFRYLPDRGALSSDVVTSGVEEGPYLTARDLPARGPGGWGLQAPLAAEFEAPGSTLRSAASDAISQPFGPRLTAEAWVVLSQATGRTVLVSNQISGAGSFTLGLDGATPFFTVSAGGQDVRVDAPVDVALGAPLWAAGTASFDIGEQTLHVALYVNGRLAASVAQPMSVPSPYVITQPIFVGTEATGTPASPTMEGSLTGLLLAATVRDYVADAAYLTSSVPLDGGPYFGLPDYHDYPLDAGLMPMDQRILENPTPTRRRFFVPYVDDEFVPQGTATHVSDDAALVYIAYYHLTRSGVTGQRRSMIAEIDSETGHVRRTFRLMGELGFSHAGGIAYVNDAIYVSSSSTLERYPLPPYDADASPYIDLAADASGTISVYGRASFVSAHRDTLWVGDWRPSNTEAPYLYAYPLGADGKPTGAEPSIFALPRSVQGVDLFEARGETYLFFSRNRSQARGEANILRVKRGALQRWTEPAIDSTITTAYGIEDLSFFPDGSLWTNSESSADRYQRGSDAWTAFYPFVYSLPAEAVLGATIVTADEERPERGEVRLDAAPNPFRDRTTLRLDVPHAGIARVRVTDVLGREVATLLDGPISAGSTTLTWDAAAQAAGLYLVVVETAAGRATRTITLSR